jgi:hypothetical protein
MRVVTVIKFFGQCHFAKPSSAYGHLLPEWRRELRLGSKGGDTSGLEPQTPWVNKKFTLPFNSPIIKAKINL